MRSIMCMAMLQASVIITLVGWSHSVAVSGVNTDPRHALSCNRHGFLFGARGAGEDKAVTLAIQELKQHANGIALWTGAQPAELEVQQHSNTTDRGFGRCASRCTCYSCDICGSPCGPCNTCSCCDPKGSSHDWKVHVYGRVHTRDRDGCERVIGALWGWFTAAGASDVGEASTIWKIRGDSQYAAFRLGVAGLTWHAARAHCQSLGVAGLNAADHGTSSDAPRQTHVPGAVRVGAAVLKVFGSDALNVNGVYMRVESNIYAPQAGTCVLPPARLLCQAI